MSVEHLTDYERQLILALLDSMLARVSEENKTREIAISIRRKIEGIDAQLMVSRG